MKILMTGATGFIGKRLVERLVKQGHDVAILSRNIDSAREALPYPCEIYAWDPMTELPPAEALRGVDAVLHLAGHPVAAERWSASVKKKIRDSRLIGTKNLVAGLRRLGAQTPSVFVSASAIGYYGDRGEETLTETSTIGTGFLPEVCEEWEKGVLKADIPHMRTVCLRLGIVLGGDGGALGKMLPPFRAGVGGPLGSGQQWMSWVHIDDVVGLFLHALTTSSCHGVLNATAPNPVTNREFTKILAKVLHRPAIFVVPSFVLRVALGEMATILLGSTKALPEAAKASGYVFQHTDLEEALRSLGLDLPDSEITIKQWFNRPVNEVFQFFEQATNLEMLTPSWLNFNMVGQSTPKIQKDTLIDYKIRLHGIPIKWQTRIDSWQPDAFFEDSQIRGPYAKWHHKHIFETVKGGTLVTDRVLYRLPGGPVGKVLGGPFVRHDLRKIFKFRKDKLKTLFLS